MVLGNPSYERMALLTLVQQLALRIVPRFFSVVLPNTVFVLVLNYTT